MSFAAHYYNHLSKTDRVEKARTIRDPAQIRDLVGPVERRSLKGCVVVWDSMVDDARLTLLTLKDAHRGGAVVANYVRFVEFIAQPGKTNGSCTVLLEDVSLANALKQSHENSCPPPDLGRIGSGRKTPHTMVYLG